MVPGILSNGEEETKGTETTRADTPFSRRYFRASTAIATSEPEAKRETMATSPSAGTIS